MTEPVRQQLLQVLGQARECRWAGQFDQALAYYREVLELGERTGVEKADEVVRFLLDAEKPELAKGTIANPAGVMFSATAYSALKAGWPCEIPVE